MEVVMTVMVEMAVVGVVAVAVELRASPKTMVTCGQEKH
jgi:hypothetical protein